MQYIYSSGDSFAFMDTETYEQIEIPAERLNWEKNFMLEGSNVSVTFYESEILGVQLEDKVTLEVVETAPAVKGASTDTKDATLETGYTLKVPQFIAKNEKIIVSTIDGTYVSRA
jgi:elongation factor P